MPLATMDSWGSESLAEQAYRILERSIVTLELEPGSVVNERTLIELTGMGRTPMREAIQRLAWEGLVEVRPRSGIAIAAIDPKDFIKVLDAREGVERVLARDAARFGSPRDYERLEAAAAAMRQAIPGEDVALFLDADKAFDIVLGAAASNPYAARIAAPLQSHSRRFWFRLRPSSGIAGSANAHATLIEAIISRQPDRASDTASELIAYLRTLAPDFQGPPASAHPGRTTRPLIAPHIRGRSGTRVEDQSVICIHVIHGLRIGIPGPAPHILRLYHRDRKHGAQAHDSLR